MPSSSLLPSPRPYMQSWIFSEQYKALPSSYNPSRSLCSGNEPSSSHAALHSSSRFHTLRTRDHRVRRKTTSSIPSWLIDIYKSQRRGDITTFRNPQVSPTRVISVGLVSLPSLFALLLPAYSPPRYHVSGIPISALSVICCLLIVEMLWYSVLCCPPPRSRHEGGNFPRCSEKGSYRF